MKIEDIVRSLQEGAAAFPGRADRWFHLAVALSVLGRREEALTALERALAINVHYAEAAVLRCFLLGEEGRTPEAFREFRILFARSPEDFGVVFPLGVFCMRHGWTRSGLSLLLRAEALRPRLPYVLVHSAAALLDAEDGAGAAERVRRASEILSGLRVPLGTPMDAPVGARSDDTLATSLVAPPADGGGGARDADGGVDSLVASCRRWENPLLARLPILAGDYLRQKGDADGAESALRLGNAAHPGHTALLVALGSLLVARGRSDEAACWLRAAVQVDASCHEAWFELSFLLAEEGDLQGAHDALATAVSLRPLFPDYRYQYGILSRDLGRPRESIAELARVHLLNPRSGYCSLHLAEAHLEVGELDEALWVLQEASPRDLTEGLVLAARMHLRCGDRDEARKLLEKVLESGYSHEDAFAALDALRAPACAPPGTGE